MSRAQTSREMQELTRPFFEKVFADCSESFVEDKIKTYNGVKVRDFLFVSEILKIETSFKFSFNERKRGEKEIAEREAREVLTPEGFVKRNIRRLSFFLNKIDENEEYIATQEYRESGLILIHKKSTYKKFTYKPNILFELTKDEVKLVKDFVDNEYKKFEKRLNRYLKTYGVSKVKSKICGYRPSSGVYL